MSRRVRFLTRLWFYFRIGYSTYLTFLLGAVNTLVVVWYLAIKDIPLIEEIFGHFIPFAVVVTLVGGPASIAVGWAHYKRTSAYTSEVDIQVEANPYNFMLMPGKEKEVWAPMYLEYLVLLRKLAQRGDLLDAEDVSRVEALERKLKRLLEGGFAGTPRRKV